MTDLITNTKTPEEPSGPENVTNRCHILLAEDDLEMRKLLSWSLRDRGYEVTECEDGDCLLKRLGLFELSRPATTFDLIISDIRMPGITGLQGLEGAKKNLYLPPMILITAFGDELTHARAEKLGVAAMFDKPFEIDDLLAKVIQILPSRPTTAMQAQMTPGKITPKLHFAMSVDFRHGSESEPARDLIMDLAGRLGRFDALVQHLHVVIDQSDPGRRRKHRYLVTLTAKGTGKSLIVRHDSDKDSGHENIFLAIQSAFGALYRRVQKHHDKLISQNSISSFTDQGTQS